MPTLDQPLFTEGYCSKCKEYYNALLTDDKGREVTHKCGQRFTPEWRRLIVSSMPYICPICTGTVYREKVTPVIDAATGLDTSIAATFVIVQGKINRHMCEVPLKLGGPPSGEPLHPDFYGIRKDGTH